MIEKLLGLVGKKIELLLPNRVAFWGPYTIKQVGRGTGYTGPAVLVLEGATGQEYLVNISQIIIVRPVPDASPTRS